MSKLDASRRRLFLDWLNSHCSLVSASVKSADKHPADMPGKENLEFQLESGLKNWFESLPIARALWERRLILGEIAWWRDLDEQSLTRIMEAAGKE
ncbi:MAG: hypothetical protein ACOYZ8_06660 [Chloroflexota bacterium]